LCARPSDETVPTIRAGDAARGVLTACGEIRVTYGGGADLFTGFDAPIVERFAGQHPLRDQFILLLAELATPRVGTRALTEALLKQSLVLLLRRHMDRDSTAAPWLAGLADPQLAPALSALLDRSSEPFTVESLAQIAGMSRSAFAAHFVATFRRSPMSLLREVRLRRARDMLAVTRLPVEIVARRTGFASRSNFSRAFRDLYGVDPTAYRTASSRLKP
jgi:transcriptional regulator GlxA family with amidase domain